MPKFSTAVKTQSFMRMAKVNAKVTKRAMELCTRIYCIIVDFQVQLYEFWNLDFRWSSVVHWLILTLSYGPISIAEVIQNLIWREDDHKWYYGFGRRWSYPISLL